MQTDDLVLGDALAALAHELRTPLTAILGFADLLTSLDGPGDEAIRHDITERIVRNTRQLEALLDNLLDAATHGQPEPLHPRPVSLRALANEVLGNLDGALGNHPVDVHGNAAFAYADPYAVTRILLSLLTNAAQYSPDGTTIDVETSSLDGRAVLTVTDAGPGIPDGEREAVFARFWRGDWARGRVRGLGVGLSIARDLCELSGGDIHLCEGSPAGARFEVVLPTAG